MAFADQTYCQTKLTEITMKVGTILNDFVSDVTPNPHQIKRSARLLGNHHLHFAAPFNL